MKTVLRACQVAIYAAFYSKGKRLHIIRPEPHLGPSLVPGPDKLIGNLLKGVAVHQQVQLINHYWIKPISWILIDHLPSSYRDCQVPEVFLHTAVLSLYEFQPYVQFDRGAVGPVLIFPLAPFFVQSLKLQSFLCTP